MKLESLEELLIEQLRDTYSAESQIIKALPQLAKKASHPKLKEALQLHVEETGSQIERLQEVARNLNIKLTGKKCKGMEGLLEEGSELLDAEGSPNLIDAAIIAACQRVEHYEIAAYGVIRALFEHLGHMELAEFAQESLDEESAADEKLSLIAEEDLLPNAESNQRSTSVDPFTLTR